MIKSLPTPLFKATASGGNIIFKMMVRIDIIIGFS